MSTSNLMSPLLWQSVPFKDEDAFTDFLGQHNRWHALLSQLTNTRFVNTDDLREQLDNNARMHADVADALGIPRVDDLRSFDLTNEESFVSFLYLESRDLQRLRQSAGV